MIHTDEPRIGKDRPLNQIEAEAVGFLEQMKRDGGFQSEYQDRVEEVLQEIQQNATRSRSLSKSTVCQLTDNLSSHGWTHSTEELTYGVRAARKHSRKCIMRSQYESLRLCDLRNVKRSAEMGEELVRGLQEAFNGGDILPTVFVFPARRVGGSGPMIWNQQLLAFAGYTNDDGSILGDPMNASLTASIIELGWEPPKFRTKWDLLPLVTVAVDDEPAITDISKEYFPLVHIRHPRYELAFEKLGLRWVPTPALSQLGFDIGGVQYTASPFVGWFMDAEIGVCDLADSNRYNVLPNVIRAIYPDELRRPLDQLPEHERLNLLCRAQAELNFAVSHSFSQASVRISDTLTASANYCQFDDEHVKRYGFRLPADPYWLAPPQGSVIPIWHRGGAPHYQPKPMICRHRENPVRAWKRRSERRKYPSQESFDDAEMPRRIANGSYYTDANARILIHYCSTGIIAAKLANAVYDFLHRHLHRNHDNVEVLRPTHLGLLDLFDLSLSDTVIAITSSSGRGDIPPNGQSIVEQLHKNRFTAARFAVFGNGDSSYADSFNGAARTLHAAFQNAGLRPLCNTCVEGDNANESPPWARLESWLDTLPQQISNPHASSNDNHIPKNGRNPTRQLQATIQSYSRFAIEACNPRQNLRKVILSSKDQSYSAMDYLQVLVPNHQRAVREVLQLLRKKGP